MTTNGRLKPLTEASLRETLAEPRSQVSLDMGNGREITLICAASLRNQASMVLELLRRKIAQTRRATNEVGPSEVTVRPEGNRLKCYQPDFLGGNPLDGDETDDLTLTCLLLGHQVEVSLAANIEALDASLFDAIMVDERAFTESLVLLRRNEPAFERHTGWYLISSSGIREEDPPYKPMAVFEVLRRRPSLLAAMAAPMNHIAQFRGENLVEIVDESNRPVYRP